MDAALFTKMLSDKNVLDLRKLGYAGGGEREDQRCGGRNTVFGLFYRKCIS